MPSPARSSCRPRTRERSARPGARWAPTCEVVVLTPRAAQALGPARTATHAPAHGGDAVVTAAPPMTRRDPLLPVRAGLLAPRRRRRPNGCSRRSTRRPTRSSPAPRREADAIRAEARAQGEADAAGVLVAERARARRQARAVVLAAQREAYEELRSRVRRELPLLRADPAYAAWTDRLARRPPCGARARGGGDRAPRGRRRRRGRRAPGRLHPDRARRRVRSTHSARTSRGCGRRDLDGVPGLGLARRAGPLPRRGDARRGAAR